MATEALTPRKHNIAELNRKAAYKIKHGSPKFRDVLRARCKARMKENRDKIVCKLRSLHSCNDVDNLLSTLGNAESGVTYSLSSFGLETEASTLTKEEEEIIAEYEALLASEEEMFSEMLQKNLEDEVVCPVCQKTALQIENVLPYGSFIVCHRCDIRITAHTTLLNLGHHIQSCISDHNSSCLSKPQFHTTPEDDGTHIYMLCAQCSYLNIIS
ncbi:RPA-interacting protein [Zootermopsis nevadensis]|uniref:RPA-interacting protein n=1 Tax=Zootermopsis nevadensis TaxID=136037 RepID=A0A067QL59_ZOONE|nr:RPA-interacting protein [Zootermopsis nevadensis]KDR09983.1 RPA-interacting protein [Zootermopsis nevadensis]